MKMWIRDGHMAHNKNIALYLLCYLPLIPAGYTALSRTWDYKHGFGDILAGSLIGMAIAYFCFERSLGIYLDENQLRDPKPADNKQPAETNLSPNNDKPGELREVSVTGGGPE